MRLRQLAMMIVGTGMLLTAGLAAAQSPAESGTSAGQDWKTIIYPVHAWLPVFGADVTLPGQSTPPGSGGGSATDPAASRLRPRRRPGTSTVPRWPVFAWNVHACRSRGSFYGPA